MRVIYQEIMNRRVIAIEKPFRERAVRHRVVRHRRHHGPIHPHHLRCLHRPGPASAGIGPGTRSPNEVSAGERTLPASDTSDAVLLEELRALGRADRIAALGRLPGGTAADVWLITYADATQVIGKTVTGAASDLFEAEADGLTALRGTGHLATPQVLAVTRRLLLLEALAARDDSERSWEGSPMTWPPRTAAPQGPSSAGTATAAGPAACPCCTYANTSASSPPTAPPPPAPSPRSGTSSPPSTPADHSKPSQAARVLGGLSVRQPRTTLAQLRLD
jgi:hypothetical protein